MDKVLENINSVYVELDEIQKAFSMKTGLHCKNQCGACCQKPSTSFQCSETEALYIAKGLRSKFKKIEIENIIKSNDNDKKCPFHDLIDNEKGLGSCTIYELRPVICRLFGASIITNKKNLQVLLSSRVMNEQLPEMVDGINAQLDIDFKAPIASYFQNQIESLNNSPNTLPIDQAVLRALEKFEFLEMYKQEELNE